MAMLCGPNDGGIKRGDRADTGPDQAGHKDGVGRTGSGVPGGDGGSTGHVTGAPDSEAEPVDLGEEWLVPEDSEVAAEDIADFTVTTADDPSLGMTDIAGRPPEDWAADAGPSRNLDANDVDVQDPPPAPEAPCAEPAGGQRKAPERQRRRK